MIPDTNRAIVLLIATLVAAPVILATPDARSEGQGCEEGMRTMEGVGPVCPRPNGLYEVYGSDGSSLGFIHGTDPIPPPEPEAPVGIAAAAGTQPFCVSGAAGTYYVQVIYARANNDVDNYNAMRNSLRWLVGQANKKVHDAAVVGDASAALKVKCVDGEVEVKNEALPTVSAAASFSTIVTDLRNRGYNSGKVKYWVFYDDTGACTCGGTGHIYGDDSLSVGNANNGNQGSMFAVTFGYNSTRIMLHELGHNLGAVQNSAPSATGGYHCVDGHDVMCYNDGGPNGGSYNTNACSVEVWDCNKNDYFNAAPAPGSYLATHWNLASPLNRFIHFGSPYMTSLLCPAGVDLGVAVECSFQANDDSSGVRYTIEWDDGTTAYVPSATTYTAPDVARTASHTYTSAAHRTVRVSVVDIDGYQGSPLSTVITVFSLEPVMDLLTCTTPTDVGTPMSCSFRAFDASSVSYAIDWGDGTSATVPASGFVAPSTIMSASHAYGSVGERTVSVTPTDDLGNVGAASTLAVSVLADITPPQLTVSDPRTGMAYVGCGTSQSWFSTGRALVVGSLCVRASASDAGSGIDRVEVWLDGVLRATDATAPYAMEFPVPYNKVAAVLIVRAIDGEGNARDVRRNVDMVATV